jgi:hypothetical protein
MGILSQTIGDCHSLTSPILTFLNAQKTIIYGGIKA